MLIGRQAVYHLLHRLGYGDLMPRPHHEDSIPEVQEFSRELPGGVHAVLIRDGAGF